MAKLHGSMFPLPFVTNVMAQNGAEAVADVVPILAGNTRLLAEWIDGSTTAGSPAGAPTTAHSGKPGHDHSGGTQGRRIIRTLWSVLFGGNASTMHADLSGGDCVQATVSSTTKNRNLYLGNVRTIWVPGCPPAGAHYYADWILDVYATAASSVTMTWDIFDGNPRSFTKTLLAATLTKISFKTEATRQVPLFPGSRQWVGVTVTANFTTATSTVNLISMQLALVADPDGNP